MTTSANLIKGISERISDFNRAVPGSAKISDIIDGCIEAYYEILVSRLGSAA